MEFRSPTSDFDAVVKNYLPNQQQDYRSGPYSAIYRGKVINTNDPQKRGRILVRVLLFDSEEEKDENFRWAYVLNPLGGPHNSGFYIIPPIGTVGFVAYLDGDGSTAIWLGASNKIPYHVKTNDEEIDIPPLPVEMEDPTTIVLKTQYPTRQDDTTNYNISASGEDESKWIKTENLFKLSEGEFTLLKYNQGRTSKDGYKISYTYNYEEYSIDSDIMANGEVEDDSDKEDPLNNNYANFLRIKDDEFRIFYKTKVKKFNDDHEEKEFSAYSSIWMDDDGIHIGDIWDNQFYTDKDGIHFVSSSSTDTSKFELSDKWGNFVKMDKTGIWMHGANKEDNPQVDDPTGDYDYKSKYENVRFNNETPGLMINTLGSVDFYRIDNSDNKLEYINIDDQIVKIGTKNDDSYIKLEPKKVEVSDSQGRVKLENDINIDAGNGADVKVTGMNFKVDAQQNVEINGSANVKIVGGAKVKISTMVDMGGAIAEALNKSAMIISPPGVSGGPCSIAFPGQIMVKL